MLSLRSFLVSLSAVLLLAFASSANATITVRIQTGKVIRLVTNDLDAPAEEIADLYKQRWQIELFFKWIKQNLRIKAFVGNSTNAVKTQVWIAITTYVLVAIVRKRLNLSASLHTIFQVLSLSLFDRISISQLMLQSVDLDSELPASEQISLFENI